MKRMALRNRHLCFLVVMVGILQGDVSVAQTISYGDITVREVDVPRGFNETGYRELRFLVSNESKTFPHVVNIRLYDAEEGRRYYSPAAIEKTMTIPPKSDVTFSMLIPPFNYYSVPAHVSIDGIPQVESRYASILLKRGVHNRSFLCSPLAGDTSIFDVNSTSLFHKTMTSVKRPKSEWSLIWEGYTSFDAVMMVAEEFETLSPKLRETLLRYVEVGGKLVVIGEAQAPPEAHMFHYAKENIPTYYYGLGAIYFRPEEEELKEMSQRRLDYHILQYFLGSQTMNSFKKSITPETLNPKFSLAHERVSRSLISNISILVLLLMSPGLMGYFFLKKRGVWALLAVPAFGIGGAAIILGTAYVSEGLVKDSRGLVVTTLNQVTHRAISQGEFSVFCSFTPREGLRFPQGTLVLPTNASFFDDFSGSQIRSVDETQDLHLQSGWVRPRVEEKFSITKSETRRERLSVERLSDGSLSLVNGLGVALSRVVIMDEDRLVYEVLNLPAGAKATAPEMEKVAPKAMPWIPYLLKMNDFPLLLTLADESWRKFIQPNTYLAYAEESPFVESGLADPRSEVFHTVIYGLLEDIPDAR